MRDADKRPPELTPDAIAPRASRARIRRRRVWFAVIGLPLLVVPAGIGWTVLNPKFRFTLVNNSEGPITGVLFVPGPTAWSPGITRDPGGPRTFDRIEQGEHRTLWVPRRRGTTVRIFFTNHVGLPREIEADQALDADLYAGATYEIRPNQSGFCQYERPWSLGEQLSWAVYQVRHLLGL
jgi:hypothetical protein